jgi:hypothetical protein
MTTSKFAIVSTEVCPTLPEVLEEILAIAEMQLLRWWLHDLCSPRANASTSCVKVEQRLR